MSDQKYFGLYCEQCGTWWTKEGGEICYYPAPEIANAHLRDPEKHYSDGPAHLWKVQEFGKEELVSRDRLPANSTLCPYKTQLEDRVRRGYG